jgi:hypothetical protein
LSRLPHDEPDPPVDDEAVVYRLVPTYWCRAVDGQWEFPSGAIDNASPEDADDCPDDMSIVLSDTLESLGREPENLPTNTPWAGDEYGVAVLNVSYLRNDEGQLMLRTPEDDEPAHGDVCGKKPSGRRKRLRNHARWVVRPAAAPETG